MNQIVLIYFHHWCEVIILYHIEIWYREANKRRKWVKNWPCSSYFVLMWAFSSSSILAKPKSDILAFRYLSSSTFLAFMSLQTIFNLDSPWRYANPLAIPKHIFSLVGQSKFSRCSSWPTIHSWNSIKWNTKCWWSIYQKAHGQDYRFPNIHLWATTGFLWYNSHKGSQDLGVARQISCLFHLQILGFLAST